MCSAYAVHSSFFDVYFSFFLYTFFLFVVDLGSRHTAGDAHVHQCITRGLQSIRGAGEATAANQLHQYGGRRAAPLTEHSGTAATSGYRLSSQHQYTNHIRGAAG